VLASKFPRQCERRGPRVEQDAGTVFDQRGCGARDCDLLALVDAETLSEGRLAVDGGDRSSVGTHKGAGLGQAVEVPPDRLVRDAELVR
jgi:hypothetical protein